MKERSSPRTVAGGLEAIASSVRAVRAMGTSRGARILLRLNQARGFDCPGCAWPESFDERETLEFCENGVKHVADEATRERIGPEFFARHGVEELAKKSDQWLNAQGRFTHPLILRPGKAHYEPIEWEDAFAHVARELRALPSPDHAVFYTSGRTSNEAAFLYQLLVRLFGTNNLPDCSNLCHESSGVALKETIGVGKATVRLEDFEECDAIFILGQNPGTNHPRMLTHLEAARKRGAAIVSINPLPEAALLAFQHPKNALALLGASTEISTLFLPVRINGDVALLKGIMKEMLEHGDDVLDREFISEHTEGFEAFAKALRRVSWDDIVEESGIDRARIAAAARVAMESKKTIACWAMGLTQHKNAVANIQEIVNLLLLRGNVGRPGAGLCPVRGHSNVQGDRTMGISENMPESFLERLEREFGFEAPRRPGTNTVNAIRAMLDGRASVFVAMGGNFLSASPDTEATGRALRRCRLTVHVATKLNRAHLVHGKTALILPCLGRTERDVQGSNPQQVTVENSMGMVHLSEGHLQPASEHLLSEVAIVAGIGKALFGPESAVDWDTLKGDYGLIRRHIERVVPGFEGFTTELRDRGRFELPNAARDGRFETASARAQFTVHELPRHDLGSGQLLMMTIRSHDQFNTTIYGEDDRYRGIRGGRRVVLLNERDVAEAGHREGDVVDLVSHFQGEERVAKGFTIVFYPIPRRSAATYFPEANVLVPLDHVADKSETPASKSVVISLRRAQQERTDP